MEDKGIDEIQPGLLERMKSYLFETGYAEKEKRILKAAHYLATSWEFKIVYRLNSDFFGLETTKSRIESQLEEFSDTGGVQQLVFNRGATEFLNLVGQLRFQQRWAQTPRVPETSVAGHMLIVAILSYLMALQTVSCEKRKYNDFFAGLFHDMPEVLTRDIISPVKNSIDGLGELIKTIEDRQMEEVLYPMLPKHWRSEIRYFTEDEFSDRIILDGKIHHVSTDKINEYFNKDEFSPVDGSIIEFCDKFAAYMEAYLSIRHGISSENLVKGYNQLYDRFRKTRIAGIDAGMMFDYFRL